MEKYSPNPFTTDKEDPRRQAAEREVPESPEPLMENPLVITIDPEPLRQDPAMKEARTDSDEPRELALATLKGPTRTSAETLSEVS